MVEHGAAVQRRELSRHQLARSQKLLLKEKKASCSMMSISYIWKTSHTCQLLLFSFKKKISSLSVDEVVPLWLQYACPSLTNDAEHLFLCLLAIGLSSLENVLCRFFSHFDYLFVLDTNYRYQTLLSDMTWKNFPHCVDCLCTVLSCPWMHLLLLLTSVSTEKYYFLFSQFHLKVNLGHIFVIDLTITLLSFLCMIFCHIDTFFKVLW